MVDSKLKQSELNEPNSEEISNLKHLPEFAAICSFLTNFGTDLGIHLTFPQLYNFLNLKDGVNRNWETLHIKLLNKLKYRAKPDRWEAVFGRFLINHGLHFDNIQVGAENLIKLDELNFKQSNGTKNFKSGYANLSFDIRAKGLLCLLEVQFDRNQPFKDKVNLVPSVGLRTRPIGVDIWGRNYWLFKDIETNIYLYREDPCANQFQLICETFDQMRDLVMELKQAFGPEESLVDILKRRAFEVKQSEQEVEFKNELLHLVNGGLVPVKETLVDTNVIVKSHQSVKVKMETKMVLENDSDSKIKADQAHQALDIKMEPKDQLETDDNGETNGELNDPDIHDTKTEELHNTDSVIPSHDQSNVQENAFETVKPEPTQQSTVKAEQQQQQQLSNDDESSKDRPVEVRRSGRQRKPVQMFKVEVAPVVKRSKPTKPPTDPPLADRPTEAKKSKSKRSKDPVGAEVADQTKPSAKKKSKRRTSKNPRKVANPWACLSSESSSESNLEDDSFELALNEHNNQSDDGSDVNCKKNKKQVDWSDHPESDFDSDELGNISSSDADSIANGRNLARQKRLRKAKMRAESDKPHGDGGGVEDVCQLCHQSYLPDWILLCDRCDLGHHAMCLNPLLFVIPEGDWYCPRCQHLALVKVVEEHIVSLEAEQKKHGTWKRMQERLNFVNISMTNILGGEEDDDQVEQNGHDEEIRFSTSSRRKCANSRISYVHDVSTDNDDDDAGFASSLANDEEDSGDDGRIGLASRRRKSRVMPSRSARSARRPTRRRNSSDESDIDGHSESEDELLPVVPRSTRRREVTYHLKDAFKELDEALENDEKYQEEKRRRLKRKNNQAGDDNSDDNWEARTKPEGRSRGKDLSNILGPDWKEFDDAKHSKRPRLCGSMSSETSDDEKRPGSGKSDMDSEFKPSDDDQDSGASNVEELESEDASSNRSDRSWYSKRRPPSRKTDTWKRNKWRSRKPIPRFENSDDDDGDADYNPKSNCKMTKSRSRRCAQQICYRESADDGDDDDRNKSFKRKRFTKRDFTESTDEKSMSDCSPNQSRQLPNKRRTIIQSSSSGSEWNFDEKKQVDDHKEDDRSTTLTSNHKSRDPFDDDDEEEEEEEKDNFVASPQLEISESSPDNAHQDEQHPNECSLVIDTSIASERVDDELCIVQPRPIPTTHEKTSNSALTNYSVARFLNNHSPDDDEDDDEEAVEDEAECLQSKIRLVNVEHNLSPHFS